MHDGGRESVKTEHNINKGGTHTAIHLVQENSK
jgi:hypothetical protein